jgi:2-succinyl-6-hydroxy-2,4-cyclohexadiene-1-carboxylate synthase
MTVLEMSPTTESSDPTDRPGRVPTVLHTEVIGNGPRVVMAHGFTQTGRVWSTFADTLSADHQVMLVDMPGHAGSSHVAADLIEGAHLLGEVGGEGAYLGYSMGARTCLHLALARPELVRSLVLISGTAGIEDSAERADRRATDEAMADELDPPPSKDDAAGIRSLRQARLDSFLRRWLDNPLFAGIPDEAHGFAERRRNTGPGLASSLRLAGTGTQLPLWDLLDHLHMPVLVVTGGHDDKFTRLGRRMVDAIGANATHVVVPGSGHSPHLQQPDRVAAMVIAHLGSPVISPDA